MSDHGPTYTVTEYGLRDNEGNVDSFGADLPLGKSIAAMFATWRGTGRLVHREVTGQDPALADGFTLPLNSGVPVYIEAATDWIPLE